MDKDLRTLPIGTISVGNINTELKTTGTRGLGQADGRALAGVASGKISLGNYQGKADEEEFTVTAYWDGYISAKGSTTSSVITATDIVSAEWNVKGPICSKQSAGDVTQNTFLYVNSLLVFTQGSNKGSFRCSDLNITETVVGNIFTMQLIMSNEGTTGAKSSIAVESTFKGDFKIFGKRLPGAKTSVTLNNEGNGEIQEFFIDDIGTISTTLLGNRKSGEVTRMKINPSYTFEDSYLLSEKFNEWIFDKYKELDFLFFTVQVRKDIYFDPHFDSGYSYNKKLEFKGLSSNDEYNFFDFTQRR